MPRSHRRKPPAPPARRRGPDWILVGILLVTLALRAWGIAGRLPDPSVADIPYDDTAVDEGDRRAMHVAWDMWSGGARPLNLNPGTGDWPGLPFYTTLASQIAYRGYDLVARPGESARSFSDRLVAHPAGFFLAARLPGLFLGLLSVFLLYRLGSLVGGRRVGQMAAGFLAVMPAHVGVSQRISDPNLLSLVFVTAASIAMVRLTRGGTLRDSIVGGACVGLAAASKYVPGILALPLAYAHLDTERLGSAPWKAVRWRPLLAAAAAAALAFALTSPYTLLDWSAKRKDMATQQARLVTEWAGLSSQRFALPTYLVQTLPDMMTWAGYLLALGGCVLLWRRGREGRLLLSVSLLFIASVGFLGLAQPRFVLPAIGGLAIAFALAVASIAERLAARRATPAPTPAASTAPGATGATSRQKLEPALVPAIVMAGIAVWGLQSAVATQRAISKPDARHAAHAWVTRSIGPNEILALDVYGPVLKRGPDGRRALLWPFFTSHTELVRSAFHPEWLDGVRYYMTSSEVTRRFAGADDRYATERGFYEWIGRNGTRVWGSDPESTSGPRIDCYALPRTISTKEARDSLWTVERRTGVQDSRIARWTSEFAQDFLLAGDLPKAEEWSRRGLSLGSRESRRALYETLTLALMQQGKSAGAESTAAAGIAADPTHSTIRVLRAMALEAMGRREDAIEAYRAALPLTPRDEARRFISQAIARLESTAADQSGAAGGSRSSRGPAGR